MKLYSVKMYKNGDLVLDGIPCRRKSDNELGIYDTVSGKFLVNSGTGKFITSNNKIDSKDYQKVEYIESTGTQYIDTNISGESGIPIRMEIDFQLTNNTNDRWIAGTNSSFEAGVYSNSFYTLSGFNYSQNNLLNRTLAIGSYTGSTRSIYIFSRNWDSNGPNNSASVKVYSVRIYKNNELIFNGIPCYRKSDGKIGIYNNVNNEFLENSGTGTFIKGADM